MPSYELVDPERANGIVGGHDYGSSIRMLVRSPTWVVFSGCGGIHAAMLTLERHGTHWSNHHMLAEGRVSTATIEAAKPRLDELGEGWYAAAHAAWKSRKTALLDGGGKALSKPAVEVQRDLEARRRVEAPPWKADLSHRIDRCLQCDKLLDPDTDYHRFGNGIMDNHPRSVEDCQRMTNHEVIAIHRYRDEKRWEFVEWFQTWDGESTLQEAFCSDACAAAYGRRAAAQLDHLSPGEAPIKKAQRPREDVDYNPRPEYVTNSGLRI